MIWEQIRLANRVANNQTHKFGTACDQEISTDSYELCELPMDSTTPTRTTQLKFILCTIKGIDNGARLNHRRGSGNAIEFSWAIPPVTQVILQ